jgi:hypothetical protein
MNSAQIDNSEYVEDYLYQKRLEAHRATPVVGFNFDLMDDTYIEGTNRGKFMYPNWPYPYTVNQYHLYFEYLYEFFRGSRLATTN